MAQIYISCSEYDMATVDELVVLLTKAGFRIWYDIDSHDRGGKKWWQKASREIRSCMDFVFLMSSESVKSTLCHQEIDTARREGKVIIPVQIEVDVDIPMQLSYLKGLPWMIQMSNGVSAQGFASLIGTLTCWESIDLDGERRESDFQLLEELWPYISSEMIESLNQGIQAHRIDRHFYESTIEKYLDIRKNYPEKQCADPQLATSLNEFDDILEWIHQRIEQSWVEDEDVLISRYQDYRMHDEISSTRLEHLDAEYANTIQLLFRLRDQQRKLIGAIKRLQPSFGFNGDRFWEQEKTAAAKEGC
jgi:hypothetical protein